MIDPITAMAAVSSAVNLIKKAASTVDDVASLGPLLGKYFDAKATAVKAVKEAKKSGGSNMAQAIEIELALKSQHDFEEQIKGLFFSSNNMDIWNNIQQRVAEMNAADKAEAEREKDRAKNAARRKAEIMELVLAGAVLLVIIIGATWAIAKAIIMCKGGGCA
jgi:ActR/RegA family two-component response regulator